MHGAVGHALSLGINDELMAEGYGHNLRGFQML